MSFGDSTPIREELLEQVHPLLDEFRGKVTVLAYDVQLQTWITPLPNGAPQMINAWCVVVIAAGALLGPSNYISYVWTFGQTPQVPDHATVRDGIRETFNRIRIMQTRQLQQQHPQSTN